MLLFAESLAPAPQRHVDAVGRDDSALVEAVFDRVLDGDVQRIALELGRFERGDEFQRCLRERQCFSQRLTQRLDAFPARCLRKPADAHRYRVDCPAADQFHDLVAGPLESERLLHDRLVVAGHGDRALVAQEVRGVEHVYMEGMALDPFAPVEELAQRSNLWIDFDLEQVLEGHRRAHLVGDRADAADSGGDVDDFVGRSTDHELLKVARRLEDRQAGLDDVAVVDAQLERAFALDPCNPNDFEGVLAGRRLCLWHRSYHLAAAARNRTRALGGCSIAARAE